jgi:hypothetical protein
MLNKSTALANGGMDLFGGERIYAALLLKKYKEFGA